MGFLILKKGTPFAIFSSYLVNSLPTQTASGKS